MMNLNKIIKYINQKACPHFWMRLEKRVVYKVNEFNKQSTIPCMIICLEKCKNCGKVRELRTEIPNGL